MYSILPAEPVSLTVNTTIIPPKKSISYRYGINPSRCPSLPRFPCSPSVFAKLGNSSSGYVLTNGRVKPGKSGLKPTYYTRHHPSESERDTLIPIIAPITTLPSSTTTSIPEKEGTTEIIPIHQDMRFFATILSPGKQVEYTFQGSEGGERLGYIHLAQMSGYNPGKETIGAKVSVGETQEIREGDGVFVNGGKKGDRIVFENRGEVDAEFVWFEMGSEESA
jgi:hypothetical protein